MEQAFLDKHINIFLQALSESNQPLDLSLSRYFRSHKNLGAKDRRIIGNTIYGMVRWKSLLDILNPKDRLSFYQNLNWQMVALDETIPPFAKMGLSPFLYETLSHAFGASKTEELAKVFNSAAPITIRTNLLKTTREELLQILKQKFQCFPCSRSEMGIQFHKREPLFSIPEFKMGLFEAQDEGSQIVAEEVAVKPKDIVLDYCSGSGGKTLGFAPHMNNSGQIYLHDIRPHALMEARKRLKRAGVQNAQVLHSDHPQLKQLKNKCDWVLIDVPCSGSGTLRRNPDQKWKIDGPMLERLTQEQRNIAKEAFQYVKPGENSSTPRAASFPKRTNLKWNFSSKNIL